MIVDGERLVQDPIKEIREVETFLRIPRFFKESHFFYPKENKGFPCFVLGKEGKCMGRDKGRDHPPLKKKTLEFLLEKLQPMVDNFKEQTGIYLNLKR